MNATMITRRIWIMAAGLIPIAAQAAATDAQLRSLLKDTHAEGADHWIYNDLSAALAEARKLDRPIFVTFRCVPCQACAGFDAEVARGSELIRDLARTHFVSLRQVEMKGVDLTQFQFDHDLNWAAMFIHPDGTVFGRYGTQSVEGPDAYNSVASLEKAMLRVLKLHSEYPKNSATLAGKRAATKPYRTALEMPGLEEKEKLRGPTARGNCIHCHNIHDAENAQWQKSGHFKWEMLYRYPLPDNIGIHIDPQDGCKIERVAADSPAAAAGLRAGDIVTHANGQPVISIADIQWVLHHLPGSDATVELGCTRDDRTVARTVKLPSGWRKTDISWRGSMWSVRPRPGFWAPLAKESELKGIDVPANCRPLRIQWINTSQREGRAAKEAGFREGDIITQIGDQAVNFTPAQFHLHVKMNYRVGDKLPLTIVRDGKAQRIDLPLVD